MRAVSFWTQEYTSHRFLLHRELGDFRRNPSKTTFSEIASILRFPKKPLAPHLLLPIRIMAHAAVARTVETNDKESEAQAAWAQALHFHCQLSVSLAVPEFTINRLLRLKRKSIVDTRWRLESDVPLRVNGEVIAWAEFEVVGNHLAVRITELA